MNRVAAKPNGPMHERETVLAVHGLAKTFVLHQRDRVLHALDSVSFAARAGEMSVLVGSSGSGKSTALKCVYRTCRADSGRILYRQANGEVLDLAQLSDERVLPLRRNELRMVSQFLRVLPRRTALDHVAQPLCENGACSETARQQARAVLQQVQLPEALIDLPPWTFSGGEKQLVNLAHALVVKPRLLLLDEPTASLDPASVQQVVEVIETLKDQDIAMVGIFHDRRLVKQLADQRIDLSGGIRAIRQNT
jgi:alpha-D-ribose 1-methylphosphonate 5-triphosphate synthase subunit PhnL